MDALTRSLRVPRLWEGQLLSDVVAVESRLRELMGVNGTSFARLRADVVTIELR
jgi:hypothetical protein